ncbi:MAG: NAD-binding protein [Magnetococcales bacterium]|nr:NAD-binding protein [Magnetococcales bacterium]
MSLAQISEFSFVLAKSGLSEGLLTVTTYQYFLAVAVMTMAIAPMMVAYAGKAGRRLSQLPPFQFLTIGKDSTFPRKHITLSDHLIVVGFGDNGRAAVQLASCRGIAYVVLETNPETVRREKSSGVKIKFGDASQKIVLKHADIMTAKAILITVPDATSARKIVVAIRHLRTDIPVVVRTSFLSEVTELEALGANHVVAMQLEASVTLCGKVLDIFGATQEDKASSLDDVRTNRIQQCHISASHLFDPEISKINNP